MDEQIAQKNGDNNQFRGIFYEQRHIFESKSNFTTRFFYRPSRT